jgi:N-methylhydantoinase A
MLRVGPESAGADPGPICFGRGTQPTVTDANLLLGRLDPSSFLGGTVAVDSARAEAGLREHKGPLATVEAFAAGILRVVETEMERAIRVISVEQGHDPRDFALVAFGGGGPLHACSLARSLRIPTVVVPTMPGALSALGILLADVVRDHARTVMLPGDAVQDLAGEFASLEKQGRREFAEEGLDGTPEYSLDLRYRGQGYELNVPWSADNPVRSVDAFHDLHYQRYGFSDRGKPTQIVSLRLRMTAPAEPWEPKRRESRPGDGRVARYGRRDIFIDGRFLPSSLYRREQLAAGDVLAGPALITEYTSATILLPGCRATVDPLLNLIIDVRPAP